MFEKLVHWVETGLALLLIAAVLLNCLNIAGRYLFSYSIIGADELQIYGMICIAFVGLVVVSWRQVHLRMDVLTRNARPRVKLVLEITERILVLAIAFLLLAVSSEYVWRIYQLGSVSENAEIPMWIPHAAVTIGVALMAIVAVIQIVARLRGRHNNKDILPGR